MDWFLVLLWVMFAIMAFGSLLLLAWLVFKSYGKTEGHRVMFSPLVLIGTQAFALAVTSMLYLILLVYPAEPWFRWLGYGIASGFLAFATSFVLHTEKAGLARPTFAGIFLAFSQLLYIAVYFTNDPVTYGQLIQWFLFAASAVVLCITMYYIIFDDEYHTLGLTWLNVYAIAFFVFYAAYALMFALSPTLGAVISARNTTMAFFIIDFFGKILVVGVNMYIAYDGRDPFERLKGMAKGKRSNKRRSERVESAEGSSKLSKFYEDEGESADID